MLALRTYLNVHMPLYVPTLGVRITRLIFGRRRMLKIIAARIELGTASEVGNTFTTTSLPMVALYEHIVNSMKINHFLNSTL